MTRLSLLLYGLALVLLVVFVLRNSGEIARTVTIIRSADVSWLAGAVVLELLILVAFIAMLGFILNRLGERPGWRTVARSHFQRLVAGTLSPVNGPASTFAFTRFMVSHGVATDNALLALALNGVVGYGSFVAFLTPVLIMLEFQHQVSQLLLVGASLLCAGFLILVAGLYFLLRESGAPGWLLRRAPGRLQKLAEQARQHRIRPRDLLPAFVVALAIDFLGVAMLYTCLRAIGAEASLSTALTAYAVGTTFVIISPFFSGLGLVEVGMLLALRQFGIGSSVALAAILLFRALQIWMPLATGLALQIGGNVRVRNLGGKTPAFVTLLTGVLSVLSVLAPRVSQRLDAADRYQFLSVPVISRTFVLVIGALLIVLSFNLLRRRRVAWIAAIGLLAGLIIAHLLKRHDEIVVIVAAFNLLLLMLTADRYRVRSDFPSMRRGLAGFVGALVFALLYGTLGFFLIDVRAYGVDFSMGEAASRTLRTFFALGNSGLTPQTRYGAWFLDSIQIIGVLALAYATFSLTRPVVWRRTVYERERTRARNIIRRCGDSSLDVFKSWDDKLFFFSSDGQSVVAFGLSHAVAVSLGDPVAPSDGAFRLVLAEFLEFCEINGWHAAFYQVPPKRLAFYRQMGLKSVKIGEEAIVDLERFTLSGGRMKSLRSNARRLERDGYQVRFYPARQPDKRIQQLRAVSNEWLRIEGRRERTFTLGAFEDDYVRECDVFTVEDRQSDVVAFANIISDGVAGERAVDLMRRRVEPNGAMDYLFIRVFEQLRDAGWKRFSLGMVPFADVGSEPDSPLPERIMRQLPEHLNRAFSYKGLRAYKDKFRPAWEPRFLVYRSDATLPIVAFAIVRLTEQTGVALNSDMSTMRKQPARLPRILPIDADDLDCLDEVVEGTGIEARAGMADS